MEWGPGFDDISMGDVMDFLGATTPSPFQNLAFNAHWLTVIENDLRRRFERQQNDIRVLQDENAERERNAHRQPTSTTRAIADSIAADTSTAALVPIAVIRPSVQEVVAWEEAAQSEGPNIFFM